MNQSIGLKKSITWIQGASLTIGAVLGSGILILPAIAAVTAGPASLLSWLLMGLFALPMVLTIGMMSSRFPDSGGMAAYARQAFGPWWGRLTGILILSAMPLGMPLTALVGAHYLGSAFSWPASFIHIAAALLLFLAIALNYRGIELSSRTQVGVVSGILLILLFAVGSAVPQISPSAFKPFVSHGWIPVGQTMTLLFFAFMGWEMIGHLSEEFRNPRKDIPLSLGAAFLLINFLYLAIAFVTVGSRVYQTGNPATAMVTLVAFRWGKAAGMMVGLLGFIICYCTVHTYIAGFSRLIYAQTRDGNFPSCFGKLHSQHQTPYIALLSFVPLFSVILFFSYQFCWDLKLLISIPSTTFLAVYMIGMIAAAKILATKLGRASAWASAFLSASIFLFAGWFVLFPIGVTILGFCFLPRLSRRENTAPNNSRLKAL
jgi:amino acid efflux transporter